MKYILYFIHFKIGWHFLQLYKFALYNVSLFCFLVKYVSIFKTI